MKEQGDRVFLRAKIFKKKNHSPQMLPILPLATRVGEWGVNIEARTEYFRSVLLCESWIVSFLKKTM